MDGQLFARGFLPPIDVTKSVSRIGGKAQHLAIKTEAGRMKLDYLQFLELEVFTRFGSRLEASMEARIKRGQILRELLKQDRLNPLPIEFEMAWLVAHNEGLFDGVDREQLSSQLEQLRQQVANSGLTLSDSRERWRSAVRLWFAKDEHEPAA
jgi:F-type H+-transporting ATPase subunit alpha